MSSIRCVIPTLNSARTLEHTLVSLSSQSGADLEVIVVDSGSTDGTLEICERRNVRVIYEDPGNLYRAVNRGLVGSQTEWLAYLNSDDILYPDAYRRLIAEGGHNDADIVYGDCDYLDDSGRFLFSFAAASPCCLMSLFRTGRMGFAQPAAIFRNRVFRELGGFNEAYRFKADADFFIRALLNGKRYSRLRGAPAAGFRIHQGQLSTARKAEIELEGKRLFGSMKPGLTDRMKLMKWMARNLPHYAIRIIRESLLVGRIAFNRSVDRFDG